MSLHQSSFHKIFHPQSCKSLVIPQNAYGDVHSVRGTSWQRHSVNGSLQQKFVLRGNILNMTNAQYYVFYNFYIGLHIFYAYYKNKKLVLVEENAVEPGSANLKLILMFDDSLLCSIYYKILFSYSCKKLLLLLLSVINWKQYEENKVSYVYQWNLRTTGKVPGDR